MRRLITILLTITLALGLCACGGGRKDPAAKHQTNTPASEMKLPASTGSDLTAEEIDRILEEMEAAEAE